MGLTGETRNAGLNVAECAFAGAFTATQEKSGWKNKGAKELELTAHGLSTGNLIYLLAVTGGNNLVQAGEVFWVKVVDANNIEISQTNTFSPEEFAAVSAMTTVTLTEVSGGGYERKATGFAAAAKGQITDATKRELTVAEGTKIFGVGFWTAKEGGVLRCVEKAELVTSVATQETVTATKLYVITNTIIDHRVK